MKDQLPKTALLLFSLVSILTACFIIHQEFEKSKLWQQIESLEGHLEAQCRKNLSQLDSLQQIIDLRQEQNELLKDTLRLLQQKRTHLTQISNEKKAAIRRIAAVDSLYHEVARHYE